MNKIIFIGAGGHTASVLEAVESAGIYSVQGLVVNEKCNDLFSIPWLGTDDDIPDLIKKYRNAVITVGSIKTALIRKKIYIKLKESDASLPVIAASSAVKSVHSLIGEGTVLLHNSLVNAGAEVGVNCIINSGAIIEHNVVIGNHTHISTTACINGNVVVGSECFIGSGSIVMQGITIADNVIIGAGSLVRKSIHEAGIYAGNPLREIK